jgi:Domain of unknown function (DUF4291)
MTDELPQTGPLLTLRHTISPGGPGGRSSSLGLPFAVPSMAEEVSQPERAIIAEYDAEGLFVYQAFKSSIVEEALRQGTFGKGFNLERMTWIKPSFGWMLYRSEYATAHRQERILKIKLPHQEFLTVLRQAVHTAYDRRLHATEAEWREALKKTEVRYQWDPDRDWRLRNLSRRAIQLGLEGALVRQYVGSIAALEDVTALAHACRRAAAEGAESPPSYPVEREYPVPEDVRRVLGMPE